MSLGSVVDISIRILRRHWGALLGVAALLVGPVALLTAATQLRFNEVAVDVFPELETGALDTSIVLTQSEFERLGGALGPYLLATMLAGVIGTIAVLGFSAVVSADYHARPIDLRGALLVCLRRALSALGVVLVTTLVVLGILVAGVALIVLALALLSGGDIERGGPGVFMALVLGVSLAVLLAYLTTRWAISIPSIAIEDVGWRRGLSRSWHLSGDNVWRTFGVLLGGVIVSALLAAFISQVVAIVVVDGLAAALGLDGAIAESLSLALGSVLLAPLTPVLLGVLYFDLRARRDIPGRSE